MVDPVSNTFEYCKSIVGIGKTPICNWEESRDLLDCSDKEDIGRLSCHFAIFDEYYYSKIIMQFPKDENFAEINDFEKCEQPLFFQNFDNASSKLNQRRQDLSLKFAKSCLKHYKVKSFFPLNNRNEKNTRNHETYRVNFSHRKRYQTSTIPSMQRLLNYDEMLQKKLLRRFGC